VSHQHRLLPYILSLRKVRNRGWLAQGHSASKCYCCPCLQLPLLKNFY
jgi:hypothetical protein